MTEKKLELAWEAVQDIYTTHANIYAYKFGIPTFCSFGETTYLIKITGKKIQAFYDKDEEKMESEKALKEIDKSVEVKDVDEFFKNL